MSAEEWPPPTGDEAILPPPGCNGVVLFVDSHRDYEGRLIVVHPGGLRDDCPFHGFVRVAEGSNP